MKKIKEMFQSAQSRYGSYSTLLTVIVIAIVIVVNMVAGQFPDSWKNIDLSENNLYEITDQSKALLKSLDKEVEIHVLAEKDSADERIKIFLEKYTGLSKKVSVKWTDPVLHPAVLSENSAEANDVIVSCADTGKSTTISLDDMITYNEMYYYYYGSQVEEGFDAEGQLTSAINQVVNSATHKVYCVTGHGEMTLGTTLSDLMTKSSLNTEELNTLKISEIPDDCELLFFYAPTTDLVDSEKTLIQEYMKNGGDVLLVLGDTENDTPNFDALMKEYGMQKVNGYIADAKNSLQGSMYYILPELSLSDEMATGMQSQMVLLVNALGMETVEPERDTIEVEEFMTTSSAGYAVSSVAQTQGTYVLGAQAKEDDCTFTVFTAANMIDDSLTSTYATLENNTLFMNAVTSNFDDVSNVSIEAKSLEVTYNTMQHTGVSTMIVIFGVPAVILLIGFMTWLKRRKA